ncbi:hypothetical protein HELRODRAFT_185811 [Helobdella robusta]|uniref:B30.2/SPRY domain-containing protein n=1 Tax=Helobdella robusta TaxID=6412 RepID=T1FNB7_HELRO|nr:hypothetical protein HELRODRAFT_185811 [Helobdella robusta]ESN99523.1 hypothetical protein HELRODRAFT_185811 [Helobdella robusta]
MEPIEAKVCTESAADDVPSAVGAGGSTLLPANPEDKTCYCGRDRNLNICEFQCGMCLRYYHETCVSCYNRDCVPFMTNYQFFCKRCSMQESLMKRQASFGQMCLTAIANLMQKNKGKTMFSKDADIIPYIETNWELLTSSPRRVKNTWHSSISKTMLKDPSIFTTKEGGADTTFGLVNEDLSKIGPNCESLLRLLCNRPVETKTQVQTEATRGRLAKRKTPGEHHYVVGSKQKKSEMTSTMRLAPSCYPAEHPFNKDGYRYHLAEPDPHAPNWQIFDESPEWAGKPIPGYLYRMNLEANVLLSLNDRAPQLKVSDDRLTVTGEKGYSMIRANHGVNEGSWFYEVKIDDMPADSATRIGWSQSLGNLQAPCGYDKFSYSWRSKKGTIFHQSRGKHYCDSGYREDDLLGFLIRLPRQADECHLQLLPPQYKEKPLVKFKSHLYYEEKDLVAETESKLKPAAGSQIIMFLNGKCQGIAYEDINKGIYFPAISSYKNATVSVNFGPKFKYPPKDYQYRPMCQATEASAVQHALGDILYHVEHEGQTLEI